MLKQVLILSWIAVTFLLPGAVQADPHRMETTPTGWWWYYNLTGTDIQDIVEDNDARLVDIEIQILDPLRFTAAFVHNSGVYAEGWWWYYNATVADLETLLADNDARLIDIERYTTDNGPRYAAIMVDNTGPDAKAWWWYVDANDEFLADILLENEARLIDLETYQDRVWKFAAIMVDNTGADAMGWWWYFNVPSTTIWNNIAAHGTRLLEFEVHDPVANTFDAILIPNDGQDAINWWWYYDATADQLNALISQNGARIADIDTYLDGIERKFSVVMVNNSNALTTKMGELLGYGSDGSTGVYLKEVGGPVLASLQPTFVFEPSSSIKVVHHLYAMRRVMFGDDDLSNSFTVARGLTGSCPNDGPPLVSQTLEQTLQGMMQDSDNADTHAIELRYGRSAINDSTQSGVGMTSTSIIRSVGCAEYPLSEMTLVDAALLYEEVAAGNLLNPATREDFYRLMQGENTVVTRWFTNQLESLIHEVATDLGIPGAAADYWDHTRLAWKPGNDRFIIDEVSHDWRSVSGWVSLPWYCGEVRYTNKEFVFGLFIDDASDPTYCSDRYFDYTIELFREQVTAGLTACVSAVGDLPGPAGAHLLTAAYPNPFNPLTMVEFTVSRPRHVTVAVYDTAGRRLAVLTDRDYAGGDHRLVWDGRDGKGRMQNSGVYLVQLVSEEVVESRKITLLR